MELSPVFWNFIGIIIAILGVLVSVRQNKSKKLSYDAELYPLFEIKNDELRSDLEIRYKNEVVNQIYTCILTIKNYGSQTIRKEDFDEPITLKIKNCKHIFTVENFKVSPQNLAVNVDVKNNDDILKINPVMLNPSDYFTLKLIIEGEDLSIDIISRIVDIKQIVNQKDVDNKTTKVKGIFYLIGGFIIMYIFIKYNFVTNKDFRQTLIVIGLFSLVYGLTQTISLIVSIIREKYNN